MKSLKTIYCAAVCAVILSSCNNQEMIDNFKGTDFTFIGIAEQFDSSPVEWTGSAKVSVLDGTSNVLYQPLASGSQPKFTSSQGVDDNAMEIYAVWPYHADNEIVHGGLKAFLKSYHDASMEVEGLRIAHASSIGQEEHLTFQNVCSYLRVDLTESMGITKLILNGNDSEILAGLAELTIDSEGMPVVKNVTMTSTQVKLSSGVDALSGTYYLPVLPKTLEKGVSLQFENASGLVAKSEKNGPIVFERNKAVDFGQIPENLNWQRTPKVQVHSVTASEIVVSWSGSSWTDISSDYNGRYTVGIYTDSQCNNSHEIMKWSPEGMAMPEYLSRVAYVFSGLQPNTDYWVKVTDDITGASTAITAVTTLDDIISANIAEEGDYAFFNSFATMVNGGDCIDGVYGKEEGILCPPEHTVQVQEIAGWTLSGSATSHPGYVGLSGEWALLSQATSTLKEIATVIVSFKAVGNGDITVYVVDGTNREAGSIHIDSDSWESYNIELLNVSPTSKVLLQGVSDVYLDNLAAKVQKYEVVSNAPSVELGKVFWSDAYITWRTRLGDPNGYNVYVDGVKLNDELLTPQQNEYHVTGLSCGKKHDIVVAAVMGNREDAADPVVALTGTITQNTANVSPRSLSVAIENRAGGPTNTVSPALYVELYKDGSNEPLFSSIVVDGLATIAGQSFVTSLALSSAKDQRPTNVTFGRLEPATTYKFRVKSFATYIFKNRVSSTAGTSAEVTSPHGESEWSEFVSFTTEAEHVEQSSEVLFQGFDGCMINQDFINKAVGTVPSYKAAGVAVGTLSYTSIYSWGADNWAFYPLRMAHPSSQFAQYAWITGIGGNQKYPCTTGSNSTATAPEFIKGASAYKCNDKASPDLKDWYISNSAWPYQGYIGLGTDYTAADGATDDKLAFVITEALEKNLSDSKTLCTLTFKGLAMYGKAISVNIAVLSSDGTWSNPVNVKLMNSAGTTEAATVWPVGDNHKWHEHSCEINLKKGDRVGIATDKGGHALIDDIQINVK